MAFRAEGYYTLTYLPYLLAGVAHFKLSCNFFVTHCVFSVVVRIIYRSITRHNVVVHRQGGICATLMVQERLLVITIQLGIMEAAISYIHTYRSTT